jgi:hypothetical protein
MATSKASRSWGVTLGPIQTIMSYGSPFAITVISRGLGSFP